VRSRVRHAMRTATYGLKTARPIAWDNPSRVG